MAWINILESEAKQGKHRLYSATCECCGSVMLRSKANLKSTLGCRSCAMRRRAKHGYFGTRIYQQWADMVRRCTNPKYAGYHRYGGRGVSICDRWRSFECFLEDMGPCPCKMQIDRIDNDGDYGPENCRWATCRQNSRNTSRTRLITALGRTQALAAWSDETGLSRSVIAKRLNEGWPHDVAVTLPKGTKTAEVAARYQRPYPAQS